MSGYSVASSERDTHSFGSYFWMLSSQVSAHSASGKTRTAYWNPVIIFSFGEIICCYSWTLICPCGTTQYRKPVEIQSQASRPSYMELHVEPTHFDYLKHDSNRDILNYIKYNVLNGGCVSGCEHVHFFTIPLKMPWLFTIVTLNWFKCLINSEYRVFGGIKPPLRGDTSEPARLITRFLMF